ncbi:hypothetical protein LZ32DRAFT_139947 [Colletotrichum eremochloae]|nr:hypothetical protein LZ32DRAFT_139947 [Colletotrichum eremochloae]
MLQSGRHSSIWAWLGPPEPSLQDFVKRIRAGEETCGLGRRRRDWPLPIPGPFVARSKRTKPRYHCLSLSSTRQISISNGRAGPVRRKERRYVTVPGPPGSCTQAHGLMGRAPICASRSKGAWSDRNWTATASVVDLGVMTGGKQASCHRSSLWRTHLLDSSLHSPPPPPHLYSQLCLLTQSPDTTQ